MARKHLQSLCNQFRVSSPRHKLAGFTLIELLVAMVIGSIAISLLLTLVVQLLRTDQQETVRSQTQSDMQMALNYISQDLREAIYVYDGHCIQGRADDPATQENDYCPGIVNHIRIPDNSVPVLAFWKLNPLKKECQEVVNQTDALCNPFLLSGRTNSLIVYFLRRNQPTSDDLKWQGQARITRYELDQFTVSNSNLGTTTGYINPTDPRTSFRTWPRQNNNGTWTSLQVSLPNSPDSNGSNPTLVDFVDARGGELVDPFCDSNEPRQYLSPNSTTLGTSFAGVRSFYACVRDANKANGFNQDVVVFLRGNTYGRGGNRDSNLATLQTQVLGRGVVGKQPQ